LLEDLAEGNLGTDPTDPHRNSTAGTWTDRMRLILVSALQVDKAILFSAAVTVAAFVPLFTMQGVEGQIFGPMAKTYGYALVGALIATFTITPVLASLLLPEQVKEAETLVVRVLRAAYTPVLRWALDWRWVMVGIGAMFLVRTGLLWTRLGSEFLPALEEGNYWIRASMPPSMSLDAGTAATRKIREILLRHPEVITVVSQHGRPDNGSDASPFSNVELFVPLKPYDEWSLELTKDILTDELQKEFASEVPGVGFNFSQYIQDNVEEAISGVKGANSVKIIGSNLEVLENLAAQIKDQMAQVRGIEDLGIFHVLGQPNLDIKVDREKAARYGLNTGDVNTVVQAAMGGTEFVRSRHKGARSRAR
jgi:heavy metal efflux system protein